MITNPSQKFNIILANIIDSNLDPVTNSSLNPDNQINSSLGSNNIPVPITDPSLGNYNWTWNYFQFYPDTIYPTIGTDIFNYAIGPIRSQDLRSTNGNLTMLNVPANQVNKFTANIFNSTPKSAQLNFGWADSILALVNNSIVANNPQNAPFQSNFTNIAFTTGWSKIDIYIYASSGNTNFSINSELGTVIDHWGPGTISLPTIPSGLVVSQDQNAVGLKDPNINILKWIPNPVSDTFGYDIYRRGPYNSGLLIPGFDTAKTTGYYVSGVPGISNIGNFGLPPYYKVSALNSGGETIASNEIKGSYQVSVSGASFTTGISSSSAGGTLATGMYNYYIFQKSYAGPYVYNNGQSNVQIFNTGNIVSLTWNLSLPDYGTDIYRTDPGFLLSDGTFGSFSGLFLTGFTGRTSFIDSGVVGSLRSGISLIDISSNNSLQLSNINNSYALSWGSISSATNYNIYRTFYSGIYVNGSLLATVSTTGYIDSGVLVTGIALINKNPIVFDHIGTIGYGLPIYKDAGLFTNRTYDYAISAYDFNFVESDRSQAVTITAGDPFAPNTPSGITIISLNGFATLGWQNGVEPDLAGTIIYDSSDNVTFTEIGRVAAPTNSFTDFIGYSGANWFKLANYDTSQNISTLSSAQMSSGVMVVDEIQLKRFSLLTTTDIDLDYYIPSGVNYNLTNAAGAQLKATPQMTQIFPVISKVPGTVQAWSENYIGIFNEKNEPFERLSAFGPYSLTNFNLNISGIMSGVGAAILNTDLGIYFNIAYYSGTNPRSLYLNSFQKLSDNSMKKVRTGQLIETNLSGGYTDQGGQNGIYGSSRPVATSHSNNYDKNILVFISGDGARARFGLVSFDQSGIINGNIDYWPKTNGQVLSISPEFQFDSDIDNDGNIHIVYNAAGLNYQGLHWVKLAYTTGVSGGASYLDGGPTVNGISGCLFTVSQGYQEYTQPRIFVDKENTLNILSQYSNQDNENTFYYSKVATSGYQIFVKPATIFTLPFKEDYYNIAYNTKLDRAYSNYSFPSGLFAYQPSGYMFNKYNNSYSPGGYRRRHDYERFEDANLYQILQSIIK